MSEVPTVYCRIVAIIIVMITIILPL